MPARQSAASSIRTESDSGPVPRRSARSIQPVMVSMWWPYSCAMTYISASGPPDEPKRLRRSAKKPVSM
jgi:hypothetical protein